MRRTRCKNSPEDPKVFNKIWLKNLAGEIFMKYITTNTKNKVMASVGYSPGVVIRASEADEIVDQNSLPNTQDEQTISDDELVIQVILDLYPTTFERAPYLYEVMNEIRARRKWNIPWSERKVKRILNKNGLGTKFIPYVSVVKTPYDVLENLAAQYDIEWPKPYGKVRYSGPSSSTRSQRVKPKKEADKEEYNYPLFD
jgi:hypothetical protein